jgi:hypothetical protein
MDALLTPRKLALGNLYPQARPDGLDRFERILLSLRSMTGGLWRLQAAERDTA